MIAMKTYRAAVIGCGHRGREYRRMGAPHTTLIHPHAHGEALSEFDRTDLLACSDRQENLVEKFGTLHGVPKERQYLDYRELIDREKPDIIGVATQPEQRAEIIIYAVENGVKAVYAEKALAASAPEADAIVEAVERNGAVLNMSTNRRWDSRYEKMKEIIDSGQLGPLKTLITPNGQMFNHASHNFDHILNMNGDRPVAWVQANMTDADNAIEGDSVVEDPTGHGIIQFENGVTAHTLNTSKWTPYEAICERGIVTSLNLGDEWYLYRHGPGDQQGRPIMVPVQWTHPPPKSTTLSIVQDLVHSMDTGEPPLGGVRVAQVNTHLIMAYIESHRRGGARVELPLTDSKLTLRRGGNRYDP
jgi:predicted dehydrogenase